ncbi:MAG: ABC transporter permease [Sedimentisphaerales bacterium]|nr:ABC transporter permease [Sedimentisphaerales bacterium]
MYKLKLITRYLLKRRITHFAVLAVALCVFIVVVVMTVMSGLVWGFKQNNHEFVGDCIVGTKSLVGFPYYEEFAQVLERTDFVTAVSPVVKNYALLRPDAIDVTAGVEILGIDPVRHSRATNFAQTLYYRADNPAAAFRPLYDPNALGCVFGIDLALPKSAMGQYAYNIRPTRRAYALTCFPLNARGAPSRSASMVATQRFFYSDHSHTGIARVDGSTVYIPLEQAQTLCMDGELKRVTSLHVKFRAGAALRPSCARVRELWNDFRQDKQDANDAYLLDTVTVESWKEHRRASIAPMEQEEVILSVMFSFVGMTTVFIVFVVFYMIVSHKTRDIGILKSVGASNASVMALFSGFALVVGLLGSGSGTLAGLWFLARINQVEGWLFEHFGWQLWDRSVYAIGAIPNRIEPGLLAVIIGCAITACQIGALVPGYLAARLRPVETLHGSRT